MIAIVMNELLAVGSGTDINQFVDPPEHIHMLRMYQSNSLDALEVEMESIIGSKHLDDPLQPETILVQNTEVAQWIQVSFSKKFGISANIHFQFPESFIWEIFVFLFPDLPHKSPFIKQSMRWKLMSLIPDMLWEKEFAILKQYLDDDNNKQKLYQFSWRMADLYEKYLIYRPGWLNAWESSSLIEGLHGEQIWQALLWKALIELTDKLGQSKWHHASLYDRFIGTLKSSFDVSSVLPSRIFIFGISFLPPIYLDLFKAIAKHVDIHMFLTNPCRYYWGSVKHANLLKKLIKRQRWCSLERKLVPVVKDSEDTMDIFQKEGSLPLINPLLASWGRSKRAYIHKLSSIPLSKENDIDAFIDIPKDTLLHRVQMDILNLENHAVLGISSTEFVRSDMKHQLDPEDRSFTLHVCHSVQREVEVLHDRLLAILQDDPSLSFRDIVVMVTDIDSYSPCIQAVFDSAIEDNYIPYVISDRKVFESYSTIKVFISLLNLPDNRFFSEDILELLEAPILASRFGIDEEGLRYLRRWINESGVRWGLDDDHVQELELPATGQHTWEFGLTRMLLGYAIESNAGEWRGILPYDESSGTIAGLLGNLTSFLVKLTRWRSELKQPHTLEEWLPVCRKILNDFLLLDSEKEVEITLIKKCWEDILSEGIVSHYSETIPISLLREELIRRFQRERIKQNFFTGSLNICSLMPMRSIPFRAIFLIGMNDGIYPRTVTPLGFDLMMQNPKEGDYSFRDEERYFFLETLISAQKIFYISYIGRSIQDNRKYFPSILVQELMDYIGQSHYLPGDEACNCDESEQHVKAHITFHHTRMPFDPINYQNNERQSYAYQWLPAAKKEGKVQSNFIQELMPFSIKRLEFKQLKYFWSHPIRAFFQDRLQVNFYSELLTIPDSEPFVLQGINKYHLNQELLNALVKQEDTKILFKKNRSMGRLPYGVFGRIIWEEQLQEMKALAERVHEFYQPGQDMLINLQCHGIQVTGDLQHVQSNGLLRWRPSILSISQGLQLWLEHLAYNASGGGGESRLFMRKDAMWCFPSLSIEMAQDYLNLFVAGYLEGMNKPLLLLPESGGAWISTCYDVNNDILSTDKDVLSKARRRFFERYEGNMIVSGEGKDAYYRRLWRTFNLECFNKATEVAYRYLLPLFKFRYS